MPLDELSPSALVGYSGGGERNPAKFNPFYDHIAPDVVILRDGGLLAMLRLDGVPFYLSSNAGRNGAYARHFALLQLLADRQTEVTEHYFSYANNFDFDAGPNPTEYEAERHERWMTRVLGGMKRREWFISILVRPPVASRARVKAVWRKLRGADPVESKSARRVLEAKVKTAMTALAPFGVKRLGTHEHNGFVYSEIGSVLSSVLDMRRRPVPLMHPEGAFGEGLYANPVRHNGDGFKVRLAGANSRASYGRMFGLLNYPKMVRVGMFDGLMTTDANIVMTNTIAPLSRAQSSDAMNLIIDRMKNDRAMSQEDTDEINNAIREVSRGEEVRARHNWSVAVHASTPEELDDRAAEIVDLIAGGGCTASPYGVMGGEAAFWAQWPGNLQWRPRPAQVGLRRVAMMSSLDGFPQQASGSHTWGHPLIRLTTTGGTPFDLGLHEEQVGNAYFGGPVGSGKSLAVGTFATAASRLIGADGRVILLDKDNSNMLMIRCNGGSYVSLRRHEDSGIVPLRRLQNTPSDRGFAADWIVSLIMSDGGAAPPPYIQARIRKGVSWVLSLPPEQREIGAVHAFIPPADPTNAAERLRPWCAGEEKGWAFDGSHDDLDLNASRYIGIDLTDMLGDDTVLAPAVGYILHAVNKLVTGSRRVIFIAEEGKFLLPKPYLTKPFEDMVLTGRKKNLAFWFVTQQPEHILLHPLGPSLLSQLKTRFLFRNALAQHDAYCGGGDYGDGLHCTEQEFRQVREGMAVGAWSVLVQRPGTFSTICRFDLSSVPEDIAVLSGNPRTVALWNRIAEERGTHDPKVVKPIFLSRLQEARA